MKPWLAQRAETRPDAPAVAADGTTWTYAKLAAEVRRRAAYLRSLGIDRGARVGIVGDNSLAWISTAHAVWWLGATLVPLHTRATDAELEAQLTQVPLDLLSSDGELFQAAPSLPDAAPAVVTFDELGRSQTGDCPPAALRPDDLLTVLFTSGTTGQSRAVPLTVQNHLASATASANRLGRRADDHWLCCLPLCHIGGLAIVLRSVIYGTSFELLPSFDAARVADVLARRPVTLASFVPTMLHRLLDHVDGPIASQLRAVLVGGGPISPEELRQARHRGLPVLPTYGMTEACSQLATLELDESSPDGDDHLHTAGKALFGVELRVERPDGTPAEPGESGVIWARGPMLTADYLASGKPADGASDQSRFRGRWFCTEDVGRIDADGYLIIEHRKSALIVSGGENVDPTEVERVLRSLDAVADAAVVGVDDDEWGELVHALVVPRPGEADSQRFIEELAAACRAQLARFKVPRRWAIIDQVPRTASGKIRRRFARKLADSIASFESP
ncbi:MAG: o-succinylbenzoate--CoA ligase [Persicimonas sp.]